MVSSEISLASCIPAERRGLTGSPISVVEVMLLDSSYICRLWSTKVGLYASLYRPKDTTSRSSCYRQESGPSRGPVSYLLCSRGGLSASGTASRSLVPGQTKQPCCCHSCFEFCRSQLNRGGPSSARGSQGPASGGAPGLTSGASSPCLRCFLKSEFTCSTGHTVPKHRVLLSPAWYCGHAILKFLGIWCNTCMSV